MHITCLKFKHECREGGDHDVSSVYVYNGVDEVPWDVTHVRVDQSVTIIPEGAFRDRQNLKVVELPEGLIKIENDAFENCQSLMRINIPSTVEEIGDGTFSECLKLDDIVLPEELQRLGRYAFYEFLYKESTFLLALRRLKAEHFSIAMIYKILHFQKDLK